MRTTIELTEAEAQYLRDLLLKQTEALVEIAEDIKAEKYLKKIDRAHAHNIYKKLG